MRCVWKHIYGLYFHHLINIVHQRQVSCLRGRIATYIDDTFSACTQDGVNHILVHACTWGVGDDDVWLAVFIDEIICKYVLHVPGIKRGVADAVDGTVYLGVFNGFWHILDSHYMFGIS